MAKLIKSVMFAAGAGLAVGICATVSSKRAPKASSAIPADDILRLEPLFDRLDKIETSLVSAETQREKVEQPIRAALTRRIDDAETELHSLRSRIAETERRATAAIESLEARLGIVSQEIPALVESKVSERLAELEARIEAQVEARVADRLTALEKTLSEQSASISALRERATETDSNLQRLITAIERLCERATPVAAPSPAHPAVLPFESHLAEATERHEEGKKSRFTRIFAAIAMIVLPFFSR